MQYINLFSPTTSKKITNTLKGYLNLILYSSIGSIITILSLTQMVYGCSSLSSIGGDGRRQLLYLTLEDGKVYRTERFPDNFFMKAKGPVILKCAGEICKKEELEAPNLDMKALSKEGLWEEYSLKEKDGQEGKEESQKEYVSCLLYTSPSPRDLSTSRMPSSA